MWNTGMRDMTGYPFHFGERVAPLIDPAFRVVHGSRHELSNEGSVWSILRSALYFVRRALACKGSKRDNNPDIRGLRVCEGSGIMPTACFPWICGSCRVHGKARGVCNSTRFLSPLKRKRSFQEYAQWRLIA